MIGLFVDDGRAREVQDDAVLAHELEARLVDQAARLGRQRHVHGDDVRAHEQVVQRQRLLHVGRQLPGALHGDLRIVAEHLHAEAQRRVRDFDADGAEADDAERAARAVRSPRNSSCPSPPPRRWRDRHRSATWRRSRPGVMLRAARNMPASTSSFTALALAPGALNTGNALLRERLDRNVVGAGAGAAHGAQAVGQRQFVHVRRAHQDGVGVVDLARPPRSGRAAGARAP